MADIDPMPEDFVPQMVVTATHQDEDGVLFGFQAVITGDSQRDAATILRMRQAIWQSKEMHRLGLADLIETAQGSC